MSRPLRIEFSGAFYHVTSRGNESKGELYLFGSRLDDARKGGDIDLYIVIDNRDRLGEKRIEFLTQIKQHIGDQRIDLVIERGTNRPIDKIAISEGLLLCQHH
jgi:predicted nucleotidyltransferase